MSVGENIRRLRKEAGLTQEELAELLGVARSTITQWEGGWSMPRMGKLRLIAEVLHTSHSAIVSESPGDDVTDSKSGAVPLLTTSNIASFLLADQRGSAEGEIVPERDAGHDIEVPESILERHAGALALLMEDASMDRVAPKGLAIVFDPALRPANGQIAVLNTQEHGTLIRRWFRGGNTLMLVADSHAEQDDIIMAGNTPVNVLGTVVWVQSPYELA